MRHAGSMRGLSMALGCLLAAGCAEDEIVHDAVLQLAELRDPRSDGGVLAGFACTESGELQLAPASPLLARAIVPDGRGGAVLQASIVVDAIALHGYPHCRLSELLNHCSADPGCDVLVSERRCFDLPPLAGVAALRQSVWALGPPFAAHVRGALSGMLLTAHASDEQILYRAVGTTQSCAALAQAGTPDFAPDGLLGCAYSCPLVPSAARGEIVLDFDALGRCEPQVRACASSRFLPTTLEGILSSF